MSVKKLFSLIGVSKVYFTRASAYLSVLNFLMLMTTLKLTYNINISAYIVAPLGLLFAMIIGCLDYKLIMLSETSHSYKKNGIKTQLNRIEQKVDNLIKHEEK